MSSSDPSDAERRWQHPYLRLSYLIRSILGVRWDAETWPMAKAVLAWALAQQGRLRRSGWFNWREATLVTAEDMPMLLWLTLVLGLLAAHFGGCGWPAMNVGPAAAEPRFHVDTEDAYATQCQARICATLQVNRSRFSNGAVSTLLFFSAYESAANRSRSPAFRPALRG